MSKIYNSADLLEDKEYELAADEFLNIEKNTHIQIGQGPNNGVILILRRKKI